jgi:hypothetical protein
MPDALFLYLLHHYLVLRSTWSAIAYTNKGHLALPVWAREHASPGRAEKRPERLSVSGAAHTGVGDLLSGLHAGLVEGVHPV